MPGSPYLSTRCAISTFNKHAQPLVESLSESSKDVLLKARILPLFHMPNLPQNVPLLYFLVRSYSREREAFLVGKYYLKLTVNDVAMILSLPNRGRNFKFRRMPLTEFTHKNLQEEVQRLVEEDWSPTLDQRRLNLLVKYLLVVFFFPLKNLRVPLSLENPGCIDDFEHYNWPKAVHKFLHSQLEELSTAFAIRGTGRNLGYFEGCTYVLLVWMYEHSNIQTVVDDLARPRMCRWSAGISYSAKFCSDLPTKFENKEYQVIYKFLDIGDDEKTLLGDEEEDSDFEAPKIVGGEKLRKRLEKRMLRGAKEETKKEKSNDGGMREEEKKLKKRGMKKEKLAKDGGLREEKKVMRKEEFVLSDEGWRGLECRLRGYIREENQKTIDTLKQHFDEQFKNFIAQYDVRPRSRRRTSNSPISSPEKTLVPPTQLSQRVQPTVGTLESPNEVCLQETGEKIDVLGDEDHVKLSSLVKNVKTRRDRKKKVVGHPSVDYPGRQYVTERVHHTIDFILTQFPKSASTIFRSGNISFTRRLVDDLLGVGWIEDTHLNAYSIVLSARRKRLAKQFKNFLFIPPDYANCKKSNFKTCTTALISHVNASSVQSSEIILMPCHFECHWALLVCRIREGCWEYYDSLSTSRHRALLPALVEDLYEDIGKFLPEGYKDWSINETPGLPMQENGHDCGVFVMKYMEAVVSNNPNTWDRCSSWQVEMPKFRAEITCDILKTFGSLITPNVS